MVLPIAHPPLCIVEHCSAPLLAQARIFSPKNLRMQAIVRPRDPIAAGTAPGWRATVPDQGFSGGGSGGGAILGGEGAPGGGTGVPGAIDGQGRF